MNIIFSTIDLQQQHLQASLGPTGGAVAAVLTAPLRLVFSAGILASQPTARPDLPSYGNQFISRLDQEYGSVI